jgi:hypothetical protein
MLPAQDQPTLIVVESCSSWPSWEPAALAPIVVEQRDDEPTTELADRVAQLITEQGAAPRLALIVCNERVDEAACAGRSRLIAKLLARAGVEAIVLATSDRGSGSARRALAELASDCNARFDTACVSVRFGPGLSIPPRVAA